MCDFICESYPEYDGSQDPSAYFPMDDIVRDVMGQNDPLMSDIDNTLATLPQYDGGHYDPVGDLAPVLDDNDQLGQVISGVLDDPNAALPPETEDWLAEEIRRNGHYNNWWGGLEDVRDLQQGAIDDLRRSNEQDALNNRINELYNLLNGNAGEINSWPTVDGGYGPTYPVYPWPNY